MDNGPEERLEYWRRTATHVQYEYAVVDRVNLVKMPTRCGDAASGFVAGPDNSKSLAKSVHGLWAPALAKPHVGV